MQNIDRDAFKRLDEEIENLRKNVHELRQLADERAGRIKELEKARRLERFKRIEGV